MVFRRITIIKVTRAPHHDVNELLQMLGGSLGLFSMRDKDKSCFRVFITLIKEMPRGEGLTSDELAILTGLTRGTVVFHLNKLMASGIVEAHRNRYTLAVDSMEQLIGKVEADVQKTLQDLRATAQEIDKRLGLQ